ncbi:MAG: 4-hydroxythreonine-4-phosphate dehydrogenase PdxA [Nitrospira bacterium HGW-Nitrospira-1]|nr:MAG: 4-hydroxythreonine-4-phosphate dehydrogenase PdxA [Nitrospira bacterium HGW-Nitrospira-1]
MKKIAITMGDPAGVGAEIILKAFFQSGEMPDFCVPIVIGDQVVMEEAIHLLGLSVDLNLIQTPEEAKSFHSSIDMIDLAAIHTFKKKKPTAEGGRASAAYIRKAVELALKKQVDAMVTAPISKEALKMAGMKWPGHTEMIAELTGARDYAMMLVGGPLRVILVTIHTAIRYVPDLIKQDAVLKTIHLAQRACSMLGITDPRIAVAGLNPHAGEAGIFGDEEIREIIPAIEAARREGIEATGPFPPDTIFHKAYKGEVDIVVCMYHDQGLIPLKMIAFDKGVNVTVGIPIIRTSPDHGTAYDIAWSGHADPSSMIEAVKLASQISLA